MQLYAPTACGLTCNGVLSFGIVCVLYCGPTLAADVVVSDAQVTLSRDITIPSASPGIVRELSVVEGQSVAEGDSVAQLDDRQAISELRAAQEALQVALLESENDVDLRYSEMTLAVHEEEYEHSQSANKRFAGSVSGSDLRRQQLVVQQSRLKIEQSRRDMEIRQAKVAELRARLETARLAVDQLTIRCPIGGIVAQRLVDAGEWVAAGAPVVRVIDLSHFRVECFVDQSDLMSLRVGSEVEFVTNTASETPYRGVLQFVAPELHPVTGQARVWAEVGNHDGLLKPGMRGSLSIRLP